MCSHICAQDELNPVADPAAVVVSGNARFTVLTSKMIRIEYSSTGQFEDRSTFAIVNRRLPVPSYTSEEADGYLYIRTSDVTLRYKIGSTIKATDKKPDNLMVTFMLNGITCTWYPGKDDALNLLGTNRTLDTAWGDNARGKLEKGLLSRAGWSLIDESPSAVRGDGSTTLPMALNADGYMWWEKAADAKAIDWYFLGYGHQYKECIQDFTRVGGRVPLPPKYIFGYWYSRYMAYTQSDFINIIRDVENNDIPMDVIIMDMDWHKSGWTGWSWNTSKIPNPTYLINYMHTHGLRTALNLHPSDGISNSEDKYKNLRTAMGLPSSYTQTIPWNIQDYSFARPFFDNIIRPLEKQGVDFWWLDWQQEKTVGEHASAKGYTLTDGADKLSETFWCNHTFFEDMQKNRPDLRPVIYHRWGGLGSHRYPICFSGDTWAAWSTLGYEIFFTSNASNVCYAYWGHDLGGHQGGDNDPELLLRWLQFGAFTPIFRTHATNDSKLERRIWKYSNFTQLREAVRMRYQMFPYLYTAARETYDTGIGMNRPLYYEWPEENNAYVYEDEYMFGNDMLVAPIYTASKNGISSRNIWLPTGQWWDVTENRLRKGGSVFRANYTLDQFPVFYRPGSIIPFYPVQRSVITNPEEIILKVVPGADGTGTFYEDNGNNQDYRENGWTRTTFSYNNMSASTKRLVISPREGSFEGMPATRTWTVQFLGIEKAPQGISVSNGVTFQDSYDADAKVLAITIQTSSLDKEIVVQLDGVEADKGPEAVAPQVISQESSQSSDVSSDRNSARAAYVTKLYVRGSAIPGGIQELTGFNSRSCFKYHGKLLPGTFVITPYKTGGTRFYKPVQYDSNIVNDGISYTSTSDSTQALWTVLFEADNYRFTVTPTSSTAGSMKGELFTWWYETWICGGCVEDNQTPGAGNWQISCGKAMEQSSLNPYEWTWTGELRNYTSNDEPKRFKINGQYGWSPKVLHPFKQDENILTSKEIWYNGTSDYKWSIVQDGYYRITVNVFKETISGEYLGNDPVGVGSLEPEAKVQLSVRNRTIQVSSSQVMSVFLLGVDGQQAVSDSGNQVTLEAPHAGVYILHATNGKENYTRKITIQ
jgi:alpha-glucosidase (family GH31 glycosyl hydrolase)